MRKLTDLLNGRGVTKYATNESFQLLIQCWSLIGVKPLKPYRFGRLLHMCFCWFLLLLCPFTFFMGYLYTLTTEPITIQLSLLQTAANVIGVPLKTISIAILRTYLRRVEPIFDRLDERYQSGASREQIKDCVMISTRIFTSVGFMFHFYGCTTYLQALLTHSYPLSTWLPFIDSISQPTVRYWAHYVFEVFHIVFILTVQTAMDLFPAIYIRTLRTHFNLLTERVSHLGENPGFTDEENFDELVDCVVTHQELLEAKNIVSSVCSITLFVQFVIAALALCITLLNFFVFADSVQRMVTLLYYLGVVMQITPTCYQASMMEVDSAKLPDAIFHCNWLAMDKRSRKLIIYFIHRAQENITFVALKLFNINLTTNLSIIKFGFSLYTFMNNMGFGQNLKEILE
ncbi:odorant receptor 43b-like [Bactrocera tryoni]|uniref:odorant receptor 43b-like n=1 Tax=Bactrocera tryoni TaxID=59916 RepID=UPI001A96B134|nr:odorant receptor 43b-like [Bactrocera tryoni]XP_039968676.1 odorant receptor 43b-like [Bactrocera tryoni]XP_039968680.1 odorant receptor 43b-like [Bactrocera tryoni]XP_039968685.1 odorant receptor 43b-like [Bactrocera tryoni]